MKFNLFFIATLLIFLGFVISVSMQDIQCHYGAVRFQNKQFCKK